MLNKLRIRLTILYLLFSMAFVILVGAGSYFLLDRNFKASTDLALQYRLVQQLRASNLPVPQELTSQDYLRFNPVTTVQMVNSGEAESASDESGEGGKEDQEEDREGAAPVIPTSSEEVPDAFAEIEKENEYSGELAAIFVLAMDENGALIPNARSAQAPITPDKNAQTAATTSGLDLRTVTASDGTSIRLLTYHVQQSTGTAYFQLGRPIDDQQRVLEQVLTGLIVLGSTSLILLTVGSWLLAGRSLRPTQRAFERQQAFVANASHELRTPLTLIRASAELASRSEDQPEIRSLLSDVLDDVDYMSRLVKDLLLLSSLDAKTIRMEMTPVALQEIFDEIQRKVERIEQAQHIRFLVNPLPPTVRADALRLRQLLWILIDNALQYTPAGGEIHLGARTVGKTVQLTVSDSGRGIPPEDLRHVFERFYRARNGKGTRGAGLGLAIARGLVESMGGTIAIASQPGKGTQVILSLEPAQNTPRK